MKNTATIEYVNNVHKQEAELQGIDTAKRLEQVERIERESLGYHINTAKMTKAIFGDVMKTGERIDDSDLILYI